MTVPYLPLELWEQIADFLPESYVLKLYSVNREFFYIALKRRSRTAVVDAFAHSNIHHTLLLAQAPSTKAPQAAGATGRRSEPILDQAVRERVRKVVVCDTFDCSCLHDACRMNRKALPKPPSRLRRALSNLKFHLVKKDTQWTAPVKAVAYYGRLMDAVDELESVRDVEVRLMSTTQEQYQSKLDFTNVLLRASAGHVTNLDINCALTNLERIMTADLVLPMLKTLRLVVCGTRSIFCTIRISSPLHQFLQNNCISLTHLELAFAREHDSDTACFLSRLPKFPLLSTFVVVYQMNTLYNGERYMGLDIFLLKHKEHLRSLTIMMRPAPPSIFSPGLSIPLRLQVDNLQHLTLGMLSKTETQMDGLPAYLHKKQNTLLSLQLLTWMWTCDEFQLVFFNSVFTILKRLAITTNRLTPKLLSLLAVIFPNLEELVIHVSFGICSDPNTEDPRIDAPFSRDIAGESKTLREWHLPSLTIIAHSPMREVAVHERQVIVSALPNVRRFSDVEPEFYATSGNDPGLIFKGSPDRWGSGYDLMWMDSAVEVPRA